MTTLCPEFVGFRPAVCGLQLDDCQQVSVSYPIHEEEKIERTASMVTVVQLQNSSATGLSNNMTSASSPPNDHDRLMAQMMMSTTSMMIPAFPAAPLMNLSMVEGGVFRSAYPDDPDRGLPFMAHALRLRSVVCLCVERPYPPSHSDFLKHHNIRLFHLGIQGTKKLRLSSDDNAESRAAPAMDPMRAAVEALLDERNHPVLVHCKNGKHRTGCVVGLLRKARGFPLASIFQEYRRFAGSKARASDLQLIERFDIAGCCTSLIHPAHTGPSCTAQ